MLPSKVEPWAVDKAIDLITIMQRNSYLIAIDQMALELMAVHHRGMEAAYREMNERGRG